MCTANKLCLDNADAVLYYNKTNNKKESYLLTAESLSMEKIGSNRLISGWYLIVKQSMWSMLFPFLIPRLFYW